MMDIMNGRPASRLFYGVISVIGQRSSFIPLRICAVVLMLATAWAPRARAAAQIRRRDC